MKIERVENIESWREQGSLPTDHSQPLAALNVKRNSILFPEEITLNTEKRNRNKVLSQAVPAISGPTLRRTDKCSFDVTVFDNFCNSLLKHY